MYRVCIILWDGAIIGVYTKEKIINTYPPRTLYSLWASLFFGLMKAVAAAYSGIPFLAATGIPSYVYKMIPYVATLIVLVFTSRNSQAPRASGVPYDKGQR